MFKPKKKRTARLIALVMGLCIILSSCSTLRDDEINYNNSDSEVDKTITSTMKSATDDSEYQTTTTSNDRKTVTTTVPKTDITASDTINSKNQNHTASSKNVDTQNSKKPGKQKESNTPKVTNSTKKSTTTTSAITKTSVTTPAIELKPINNALNLLSGMNSTEKKVYNTIMDGIINFDSKIDLSIYGITSEQVADCLMIVSLTNLEYNYVPTNYTITTQNDKVVAVSFKYTKTQSQHKKEIKELNNVVNKIVNNCKVSSQYDAIKYIHDAIIKGCEYDARGNNPLTAYGCLVEGEAVCEGYSKAFMLLCSKIGVECIPVVGEATNSSGNTESHMWNLVKVDGQWLHFDITWDDPITDNLGSDFVKYDYFGLSDNKIKKDHIIDGIPYLTYPKATSENGDYFTKYKLVASSSGSGIKLLKTEISKAVKSKDKYVRIKISKDSEFDKMTNHLLKQSTNGTGNIFILLREVASETGSKALNPNSYSNMISNDLNILTIILKYK